MKFDENHQYQYEYQPDQKVHTTQEDNDMREGPVHDYYMEQEDK